LTAQGSGRHRTRCCSTHIPDFALVRADGARQGIGQVDLALARHFAPAENRCPMRGDCRVRKRWRSARSRSSDARHLRAEGRQAAVRLARRFPCPAGRVRVFDLPEAVCDAAESLWRADPRANTVCGAAQHRCSATRFPAPQDAQAFAMASVLSFGRPKVDAGARYTRAPLAMRPARLRARTVRQESADIHGA
jgi:hypothetical protein